MIANDEATRERARQILALLRRDPRFNARSKEQQAELLRMALEREESQARPVEEPRSLGGFARNLPKSAGKYAGEVASFATGMSPYGLEEGFRIPPTLKGMAGLGAGLVEEAIPGEQPHEVYVDALVQHYVDRYGSMENLKRTAYEDPVGLIADVSALFSGAGAGLRGVQMATAPVRAGAKAGRASRIAGHSADVARGVAQATDPLRSVARGAKALRGAQKALTGKVRTKLTEHFPELAKLTAGEKKILNLEKTLARLNARQIAAVGGAVGLGTGDVTSGLVAASIATLLRDKAFRNGLIAVMKQARNRSKQKGKGRMGKAAAMATPASRIEAFLSELEQQMREEQP